MKAFRQGAMLLGLACMPATIFGWSALTTPSPAVAGAPEAQAPAASHEQIVGLRRLTETQYRNTIADVFGSDIRVAGRFEPIVRPAHELISSGARAASISPSGLEQFDAIARGVASQVFDDRHRSMFLTCQPRDPKAADDSCAAAVLTPIGRLLFRRPLSEGEQALYVRLAGQASGPTGSFNKGLELALAAMLVSPHFLYVVETAEPDPVNPGQLRLDNTSRASRLAFMLWNSTPNETLLKAAERGLLTDQATLSAIARHMVDSPRFDQGVRAFFSDMLLFEKFDELAKDPVIYPYFNQEVAQALPEQTLRTIAGHLLENNGDYRGLFTTKHTYMTRVLGALYQVPVSRSHGWVPYDFAPDSDRAGLLGQAGFLSIYSHSGRSSPTLRGRAIREVLMCQPVPNPPGNVNFTAVQDVHNKATPTARSRLTAHNTDPVCASCHKITDPVGLSLERFDGIGAFRTSENDALIDPTGAMDGQSFSGAAGLGKVLAESPDTTTCVASRALEYATGRPSEDANMVEALEKRFSEDGYRIRELFLRVATMPEAWTVPTAPLMTGGHASAARR